MHRGSKAMRGDFVLYTRAPEGGGVHRGSMAMRGDFFLYTRSGLALGVQKVTRVLIVGAGYRSEPVFTKPPFVNGGAIYRSQPVFTSLTGKTFGGSWRSMCGPAAVRQVLRWRKNRPV